MLEDAVTSQETPHMLHIFVYVQCNYTDSDRGSEGDLLCQEFLIAGWSSLKHYNW